MKNVCTHNWMNTLNGSLPLNQITIPGTHDSGTQFCTLPRAARCQHTSVAEQLANGFRFLDIRLVCKKQKLFLVHAQANCRKADNKTHLSFDTVLEMCYRFLWENPSETIIMSIKKDRGYHQDKFADVLLEQYYSKFPDKWYLKNETPVLNDVRGKIVLFRRYKVKDYEKFSDENSGMNFSVWPDQKSKRSKQGIVFDMETTDRVPTGRRLEVQDRYSFAPAIKWTDCVVPMLEKACMPDVWYVNFLSTMSGGCPEKSAAEINNHFQKYPLSAGCHGIISCDYGTTDLAAKIFQTNFEPRFYNQVYTN